MAGQLNENYSANVNQLAGMGTQYKNNLRREYQAREDQYNNLLYQTTMDKANTASAVGGMFSDVGNLVASDAFSDLEFKRLRNKGNNQ